MQVLYVRIHLSENLPSQGPVWGTRIQWGNWQCRSSASLCCQQLRSLFLSPSPASYECTSLCVECSIKPFNSRCFTLPRLQPSVVCYSCSNKNLYISMINQGKREQSISTNLSGDYPHQALPVKYMHMLEFPAFFGIQIETNVTEHNRSVTALVINSCHQVGCEMNPIWECITKDHQVWDVRSEVYQNEISSVDTRCLLFSSWHFPVECSA